MGLTLAAALLAASGQLTFKRYVKPFQRSLRGVASVLMEKHMLGGAFLYVASLGLYLLALRSAAVSFVYPVFASSFVFVAAISVLVLGERVQLRRLAGIALVVAGVVVIALTY